MLDPWFFGYGSLVNRATHTHSEAHPARLRGWRRVWRHTALRPVAFLTAVPVAGAEIDGLVAAVPGADWRLLDERERAYDRVPAVELDHPVTPAPEVHVYTIPDGKHGAPDRLHPVLLSYIDVVVEGFLNEFGEEGVARFFATTDGWDAPIADDRSAPRYSRHRTLRPPTRRLVDRHLADAGARLVASEPAGRPLTLSASPATAASPLPSPGPWSGPSPRGGAA